MITATSLQFFRQYLLPGFVFQGVLIGGGYATGREIVEFFLPNGPLGGLLGMGVTTLCFSLILAISFEFARLTKSYDYRCFFSALLGRWWVLFEILFVLLMFLVLSVISAAAGEIAVRGFGISPIYGSIGLLSTVGLLAFYGSETIEKSMSLWSLALYVAYLTLVLLCFNKFGGGIMESLRTQQIEPEWVVDGLRYAGYNLASMALLFFALSHIRDRRQAVFAGLLAGPLGMLPAVCLFLAMLSKYPEIATSTLPSGVLLESINIPMFTIMFQVIVFGTFVQTGVAIVHAVNERVAGVFREHGKVFPGYARSLVALSLFMLALILATRLGIVGLIADGYGVLTYGFMLVVALPVVTVGLYRVLIRPSG